MELSTFLASDAALFFFSGLGLVATGLAIARDIPVQQRTVHRPLAPVTVERQDVPQSQRVAA